MEGNSRKAVCWWRKNIVVRRINSITYKAYITNYSSLSSVYNGMIRTQMDATHVSAYI